MSEPFVEIRDLRVHFRDRGLLGRTRPPVRAVDGVDLAVPAGTALCVVGESGSGKSTLGRAVLGLVRPTSGAVRVGGRQVTALGRRDLRRARRDMQMIFQDPYSSLSPRLKVANLLTEPYRVNGIAQDARHPVADLLDMVELRADLAGRYPHELSGGQARRVGIARALAMRPQLLVADEPTAGLDVSAATSILNLLRGLRAELGLTYLVITHDIEVVGYLADTIAVMYLGRIAESGAADRVLDEPAHPYTRALLSAIPVADPARRRERRLLAPGEIPSPRTPPPACRFHPRCPYAEDQCRTEAPSDHVLAEDHETACHFAERFVDTALTDTPS